MKVAGSYQGPLERTNELVAQLDVLVSLAHVAAYSPHGYCRPTMTDGEEDGMGIILQGARHPCVELQEHVAEYIPNDVKLIFGDSSFFVLTGKLTHWLFQCRGLFYHESPFLTFNTSQL